MTLGMLEQTRRILHDFHGVWSGSPRELQGLLDRSTRDLARRSFVVQKRAPLTFIPGVVYYPLPPDHVDAWCIFRDEPGTPIPTLPTAVRLLSQDGHAWWLLPETDVVTDILPAGLVLFDATDIYWVEIDSPNGDTWFLYPSVTGDLLVSDTAPLQGPGTTDTIALFGPTMLVYALQVTDAGDHQWFTNGSIGGVSGVIAPIVATQILGQDGYAWWLQVTNSAGGVTSTDVAPAGAIPFPPPPVYWLQRTSPNGDVWYCYPNALGDFAAYAAPPVQGPGTAQILEFLDELGGTWTLEVTNAGDLYMLPTTPIPPPPPPPPPPQTVGNDYAMQEVEPEAITRIDQRVEVGPPRRYAIMGNNILRIHPSPDRVYRARLLYFSEDITALPAGCTTQPPLSAAALALERWQRLYETHRLYAMNRRHPSQQLLEMIRIELSMLAANFAAPGRDGQDLFRMAQQS